MVGQLGTAELAAVSLGNSFVFIAMSLGIGFSTAITPLVAEADGAGKKEDAKSALKHGLLLCTIMSLLLFGIILLAKPLMYLMKQPEEVVSLAIPYLDLVALIPCSLNYISGLQTVFGRTLRNKISHVRNGYCQCCEYIIELSAHIRHFWVS